MHPRDGAQTHQRAHASGRCTRRIWAAWRRSSNTSSRRPRLEYPLTEAPPARFEFVRVERAPTSRRATHSPVRRRCLRHEPRAAERRPSRDRRARARGRARTIRAPGRQWPARARAVVRRAPSADGARAQASATGYCRHGRPRPPRSASARSRGPRRGEEIREDPSWEAPLWRLLDAIVADESTALYGVCHTFAVLCRWSGAAQPVLRSPDKGGIVSGVGIDVLTTDALAHPWFARPSRAPARRQTRAAVVSRFYDLVPAGRALPRRSSAIAFEATLDGAEPAMTMVRSAREPARPSCRASSPSTLAR